MRPPVTSNEKQQDREGTKKKQCKKMLDAQVDKPLTNNPISHCSALQYRTEPAP